MKILVQFIIVSVALTAVGCGDKAGETPGYTQKDFEKTAPPAGYMNNVPKGPATSPPAPSGN